jgi:hypothetical protein
MNQDFKEFFASLNDHCTRYLIIGGVAYNHYAPPRATKDIDVWVGPEAANVQCLIRALSDFGFPTDELSPEALSVEDRVLMLGRVPNRIDVLTRVAGLDWEPCWKRRVESDYGGTPVAVLALSDLVAAKRAAGRPQDVVDAEKLSEILERTR